MKVVTIGNLEIGNGDPKICVSLGERTPQAVIEKAKILAVSKADFIEWRLDYLDVGIVGQALISLAQELKKALRKKPLLLTFRTLSEGGVRAIALADYLKLYHVLLDAEVADVIDLEWALGLENLDPLIVKSHQMGVKVIVSKHDFAKTPSVAAMSQVVLEMEASAADISKLAVMPVTAVDVLDLMTETERLNRRLEGKPVITMSMGQLGKLSRLAGKLTGSAVTFGALGDVSAPGQIELNQLKQLIELL